MRTSSKLLGLCMGLLTLAAGCGNDDPRQLEPVQYMARVLRSKRPRTACAAFIQLQQDDINCGGLLTQLIHYSPGFPGSQVTRRGHTSGWRRSSVVKVPVRYEGPDGKGKLDVTLRREDGIWRVVMLVPVP